MRRILFVLGIGAVMIGFGTGAKAQNYPWCAVYDTGDAARNCGFTTLDQCRATVSGIGGFCELNDTYVSRPAPPFSPARHRRGGSP